MIQRTESGRVSLDDPLAADLLALLESAGNDPAVVADVARAALTLGWWELFLSLVAGEWISHEFADWHRTILEWAESIELGVKPRPLIVCAPRGAGKSTALSLALVMMIAARSRSYALWIGNTARQTEDALAAVGELLAAPLFVQAYPDASRQYKTEQGRARRVGSGRRGSVRSYVNASTPTPLRTAECSTPLTGVGGRSISMTSWSSAGRGIWRSPLALGISPLACCSGSIARPAVMCST